MKIVLGYVGVILAFALTSVALAQSKPATKATKAANAAVLKQLPFSDRQDFANAKRGFIAAIEGGKIQNAQGRAIWDLSQFSFVDPAAGTPAPDTVNPSLWRVTKLLMNHGLYEVVEGQIYQVRGYDLSNMSIIRGNTGWILIDPLLSAETAAAALNLVNEKLGKRAVSAVIFTHSHIDHYGGFTSLLLCGLGGKISHRTHLG